MNWFMKWLPAILIGWLIVLGVMWGWQDMNTWVWEQEQAARKALVKAECDRDWAMLWEYAECRCRDENGNVWHMMNFIPDKSGTVRLYVVGCGGINDYSWRED